MLAVACGDDSTTTEDSTSPEDSSTTDDDTTTEDSSTTETTRRPKSPRRLTRSPSIPAGRDVELIQPLLDAFETETGNLRRGPLRRLGRARPSHPDRGMPSHPSRRLHLPEPGRPRVSLPATADLAVLDHSTRRSATSSPRDFAASDDTWVGLTGRVRVSRVQLRARRRGRPPPTPCSISRIPAYAGRVGVAPTNGSFQDFVTAMRNELGDEDDERMAGGYGGQRVAQLRKELGNRRGRRPGRGRDGARQPLLQPPSARGRSVNVAQRQPLPARRRPGFGLVIVTGGAVLESSATPVPTKPSSSSSFLLSDESQTHLRVGDPGVRVVVDGAGRRPRRSHRRSMRSRSRHHRLRPVARWRDSPAPSN